MILGFLLSLAGQTINGEVAQEKALRGSTGVRIDSPHIMGEREFVRSSPTLSEKLLTYSSRVGVNVSQHATITDVSIIHSFPKTWPDEKCIVACELVSPAHKHTKPPTVFESNRR